MPVNTILSYFRDKHKETLGYPYLPCWGKDQKIIKELCNTYTWSDISKMIELFFIQLKTDKFLQQTGASIGVFKTQIPKFLLSLSSENASINKGKL